MWVWVCLCVNQSVCTLCERSHTHLVRKLSTYDTCVDKFSVRMYLQDLPYH